ncbi:MAG: PQQ-dependent dehydrogenase, methanol/ethanol family [Vicinamibacterales bacterium]
MRLSNGNHRWFFTCCAAVLAALAGAALSGQQSKQVDNQALRAAAANGDEWLTYGRDYAETHYSPLDQINADNISRLGLAWAWDTEARDGGALEATPLVSNGVMYGTLTWNEFFAIDARTGRYKWKWDPGVPQQHVRDICCGAVNRGVALYKGRVYQGLLDGRLVALNQDTGKVIWQVQTVDKDTDTMLTAAIRVVKGKVIVGTSGADSGTRGYFSAYDADTGKLVWRFYTVPGDPSKPFEHPELEAAAKTWTGEWWKLGGGGTVWDAMAYDPDADLLYVGTGNGGPWNQRIRSPQGGDNLFLASVLAVRPDTGKLVWHFQETPGDTWDYTSTQPIVLADLTIDGTPRKVLMHAPKNGFFYMLDRITGEFIAGDKFARRVTWATGLDKNGHPIEAKGARFDKEPILLSPGPLGAHNWQPMSFSPKTGLLYIPGEETASVYAPDPNFQYERGYWNTGMLVGRRPNATPGQAPARPAGPVKEPEGADQQPKATGRFLLAWDPVANKERWRIIDESPGVRGPYAAAFGGGTLATAGNLVFQGAAAYDARTGKKLWEADLGGPNVTPITYMLDGKQYLSLLGGVTNKSHLFTFVLDGKAPMPASTTMTRTTAPSTTDPQALLTRTCSQCHALDVVTSSRMDRESWKGTIANMVARGASANAAEIDILTEYLATTYGIR